ncbi:MAG: hypothetical protein ACK5ZC_07850 [Pirellulaceae bacterium]|jgi:hypothetical protein
MRCLSLLLAIALSLGSTGKIYAALISLVLHSDGASGASTVTSLLATGQFASVQSHDVNGSGLPSLASLSGYDSILVYTSFAPSDPVGLGNLLADYVDGGGHVVLGGYSFSAPWSVAGRIMSTGYSPFIPGAKGSGGTSLVAVATGDPMLQSINLAAVQYGNAATNAKPTLDTDAMVIAVDDLGVNRLARSGSRAVVGLNFFPRGGNFNGNNAEFYRLVANALEPLSPPPPFLIPEPSTCAIYALGSLLAVRWRRRRRLGVAVE